jgi:hypothetical protein
MQLLLAGPQAFATFFEKEVVEWGKVARENNNQRRLSRRPLRQHAVAVLVFFA